MVLKLIIISIYISPSNYATKSEALERKRNLNKEVDTKKRFKRVPN